MLHYARCHIEILCLLDLESKGWRRFMSTDPEA
jgi:hypothetical protein